MQPLNLPSIQAKLRKDEGKVRIFDPIRKKYVVLTPEEWVRQHMIAYLSLNLGYPVSLFRVESGLKVNRLRKRTDIVVCSRDGKPWMLVECKAFDVTLRADAFRQAAVYNRSVGARYIAVTNGMLHFCLLAGSSSEPTVLRDFPRFGE